MENDSEDASMLTGMSPDKNRVSDFEMYDEEEATTPKIKKSPSRDAKVVRERAMCGFG